MGMIKAPARFESFASKAEDFLLNQYGGQVDKTDLSIHIGSNKDAAHGAGWRVTGRVRDTAPLYVDFPEKTVGMNLIANSDAKMSTTLFSSKIADSAKQYIAETIGKLVDNGIVFDEAKKKVYDSIPIIGFKDPETHELTAIPVIKGVNDADVASMQVPYWNITYLNKVYKQPMLKGYAKHLVSTVGVPNIWADAVSIWTESFEGMARIANVGRTTGQHNINEATKAHAGQIISEFVNIVADFESTPEDQIYGNLTGNPITNLVIGDNEKYARFMLEQLHNALIYFGDSAAGFDGLAQITSEEVWSDAPFEYIFNNSSNTTKGADMLEALNTLIGNMLEELNFLPTKVRISCSPTMYKCLKWSLTSKIYNPSSPLKYIGEAFSGGEKFMSTTPVKSMDKIQRMYEFCSDPMLSATDSSMGIVNPWNSDDTDLMFISFPEFQSDLSGTGVTETVLSFEPIANMILPYFYGNSRDGQGRTMLKRIGSILCPVDGAVKIIRGIGKNGSYTP